MNENPASPRVAVRRHGRLRRALFRAIECAAVALGGRLIYRARHLAAGRFRMRHERLLVPGLPGALEGLRVAHLSDIHAGSFLGRGDLAAVVDAVNDARADLVVITGDFITHEWSDALRVLDDLARLRSRGGTWAVFGNHDYRGRLEGRIAEAYAARGVHFLRNAGARPLGGSLVLTGLEDLEEAREIDVDAARSILEEGDVELCLCHNPRGARALARPGCVAVLSGHTHGGQVDLPGLRGLGPDHPGLRVELGPTTLIVSRGLGVIGVPLRIGSPAEVVLIELEGA